jgi:hypothetical protein
MLPTPQHRNGHPFYLCTLRRCRNESLDDKKKSLYTQHHTPTELTNTRFKKIKDMVEILFAHVNRK